MLSNLRFLTLSLSRASALRHRTGVASHTSRARARGRAVEKKKGALDCDLPSPPHAATAMLRAGRAAPAKAAAKQASASSRANPTRALDHLQQIRFPTQLSDSLRYLTPAAKAAAEARTEQDRIVRAWNAEKDDLKLNAVNRRANLRTCITRRTATEGFHLPEAMADADCQVLRRAVTPDALAQAVREIRDLRASLESDVEFWTTVQERTLVAELAAVLRVSAPGHWQSASQTFSSLPAGLWEQVETQLAALELPTGIPSRLELVTCLEILDGPGLTRDKVWYLQSVAWHFEVEDAFMAVAVEAAGSRCRGIWRPLQHEFQSLDPDPRALAALRADLLRRAASTYHNPESIPDSPDEIWRSVFRMLTRREHSRPIAAAAQAVLKRPSCPPEMEKEIRRVLRLTEFHDDALNSAWCRHLGAGAITSLPLQFPPARDYESVLIRVTAIDNVVARLNEHAFAKALLTFLQADDPFPHKVTARVDKWWRGPDNADQCENKELTKNGASALIAVAWCTRVRQLLRAETTLSIPGAALVPGFSLHTPAYGVPLHPAATALFLDLCRARGLDERDATLRLLRALQSQLSGLVSINIQTTDGAPPRQGQNSKPLTFFPWYSAKARVHMGFLSAEDRDSAITRTEPLLLFDAATRTDSTVAIRVHVIAPARSASDFQSLVAKARAKKHQHLHITKWHRYTWRDAQRVFGFEAQDIPGMEECFRRRFAELVPDLLPGAVELVRSARDAWMAEGKNGGIRVYTTAAGQLRLREGLHESKHPDTGESWSLHLPSNPPGVLEYKWTTGAVWAPDGQGVAATQLQWAPPPALAATATSSSYVSVDEAAEDLELALATAERICLPNPGQLLRQQPQVHPKGYSTLRQALTRDLPSGVTWEAVVDKLLEECADMVRNSDGDTALIESILAAPLAPRTSPRPGSARRSRSPEGAEGSNSRSRPNSAGGAAD